jgi:hypothetical protein
LCAAAGIRPVLIRRHGRQDRSTARRWALVDSRPGQESTRWGELPTDEHLLNVLAARDRGTPSADPIYLVCTHGRHDACCAIRGRPAAAALSSAFPDRTWECSHVGGDRFAANLVFLPHSLFYGHVPATEAVALATRYDEGLVVPKYLRGSGAHPSPVQAAQHFARAAGASLSINALLPIQVTRPNPTTWQIHLTADPQAHRTAHRKDAEAGAGAEAEAGAGGLPAPSEFVAVTLTTSTTTIDAAMTCASQPQGQVTTYTLTALE